MVYEPLENSFLSEHRVVKDPLESRRSRRVTHLRLLVAGMAGERSRAIDVLGLVASEGFY